MLEVEVFEDEFFGIVLVFDKMERFGNEYYEEFNEFFFKFVINGNDDLVFYEEGIEVVELFFIDMLDVSEDSFDWGDEFGSFYRLDNSDVGVDVLDEEDFWVRLFINLFDIKFELLMYLDGIVRIGFIVDE